MDYNKILSDKIKSIKPSGIRKFFDIAAQTEGVISLGVGEPDFPTPWSVRKVAIDTIERKRTVYTANPGLIELRKTICDRLDKKMGLKYDTDEVIVTVIATGFEEEVGTEALFGGQELPKRKTPELLDNDYEIPPFLRNNDLFW